MRLPQLDGRLGAALALVPPCSLCADIGSDHGRLAAALLGQDRVKRMIVSDVSPLALEKAKRLLTGLGLDQRCDFLVCDGLDALIRPCEQVCVLGMGGDTIAAMLRRGQERLMGAGLTLCAQTDHELVRDAIYSISYRLTLEKVVKANGRLYLMMQAKAGRPEPYTDVERALGPLLLHSTDALTLEWYRRQKGYLQDAVNQMHSAVAPLDAEKRRRLQEYEALTEYIEHVMHKAGQGEEKP